MKRALSFLLAALLLLVALPTIAEESGLKVGLYASETGEEFMYLHEEGAGVLQYTADGQAIANGVTWTETSLEIEQQEVPYELADGVLSFTYEDIDFVLKYSLTWDAFALGDQQGTTFAGDYEAEDGQKLTLSADGHGVYTDQRGARDVFWGSLLPYWKNLEGTTEGDCFVLFGSFLGGLTFEDGQVVLDNEEDQEIILKPVATPALEEEAPAAEEPPAEEPPAEEEPAPEEVAEPAAMIVVSPTFDLSVTLPTDRWTVEEGEGGLMIYLQREMIQYTLLSLPLEKEPSAATLDNYADHIWEDALMGAGVAYDATETIRDNQTVGEAAGRTAATEWTREELSLLGDSVLWYANGRLYVVLCVSNGDTHEEAVALMTDMISSLTTAGEGTLDRGIQLYVDKDVFEAIRDLPPVAPQVTEKVYYGYKMTSSGQDIELVPFMIAMGMDPKSISIILRSDGTGYMQMTEGEGGEFTWTEGEIAVEGQTAPFTREGDHILIVMDDGKLEFAPAEEIEALIEKANKQDELVVPTVEDLVGTWTFTKTRVMGFEVPAEQTDNEMSLVLNEDGSIIVLTDGSPVEYEWTIREDGKVILTLADAEEYILTYNGKELKLNMGAEGMEMIFEKAE